MIVFFFTGSNTDDPVAATRNVAVEPLDHDDEQTKEILKDLYLKTKSIDSNLSQPYYLISQS